jgi:hypothetical protein
MSVLYHGGVPDLKPGDTIEPGHSRDNYDDCPICRARREKGASAIEGTGHPEQVYRTRYRDYAALYASMHGKSDVYQVRPVGGVEDSDEDFDGCYRCDRLVIAGSQTNISSRIPIDSREAYMRGRAAPPTNAEIEAVAKRLCYLSQPPRQTNEPARWRNNSTRRNHEIQETCLRQSLAGLPRR